MGPLFRAWGQQYQYHVDRTLAFQDTDTLRRPVEAPISPTPAVEEVSPLACHAEVV
jgi:hypothetical protein